MRFRLLIAGLSLLLATGAAAQEVPTCSGNGRLLDGERHDGTVQCELRSDRTWFCPLRARRCLSQGGGEYICPWGAQHPCEDIGDGGEPVCAPIACTGGTNEPVSPPGNPGDPNPPSDPGPGTPAPSDPPPSEPPLDNPPADGPIIDEPVVDDPGAPANGAVNADGNCLGTIEIFAGRALRCRPPGAKTSLSNCCKDKGKILRDGMGSSLTSLSTKIAVARQVFAGMKAAYVAYQTGASAGAAASAGANAIIIGLDPTSIAISLAVNFMVEILLQGCDQQDMETGMLRGSGMCHEVGTYCSSSILGICIQEAKSHCCFNTKLGRILQEQGRPQLRSFSAIGWGEVKHPKCRGFTPEEFQALDFSRIDLSEYYSEIEARGADLIQTDMRAKTEAALGEMGQ